MMLSDVAIRKAITNGEIAVYPPVNPIDIRGAGVRVHLGAELLIPVASEIEVDIASPPEDGFEQVEMGESGYLLAAGRFALAGTREQVSTSRKLGCMLDGRSSIARQGLFVHCSSAVIDNIHEGGRAIVLELYNCSGRPIRLRPGCPVAMLSFMRLDGTIEQSAATQYSDQVRTIGPRRSFPAP